MTVLCLFSKSTATPRCYQPACTHQYYGELELKPARGLGDFPLTRKNEQAAYQLAVVVDDFVMEVTEVVRGDDLIPSIFRQLPLIDALGFTRPRYFHVPLVVRPAGRRLAKRHGDTVNAISRCGNQTRNDHRLGR